MFLRCKKLRLGYILKFFIFHFSLIKKVCMNLVSCFIDDFLFISSSQKNEIKKGKYPTGIHEINHSK